jgi:hypothetical protein
MRAMRLQCLSADYGKIKSDETLWQDTRTLDFHNPTNLDVGLSPHRGSKRRPGRGDQEKHPSRQVPQSGESIGAER